MNAQRWERVKYLYHAARARPAAERVAFLAEVCASDDDLHREVQVLLDQPVSTSGFANFVGGRIP